MPVFYTPSFSLGDLKTVICARIGGHQQLGGGAYPGGSLVGRPWNRADLRTPVGREGAIPPLGTLPTPLFELVLRSNTHGPEVSVQGQLAGPVTAGTAGSTKRAPPKGPRSLPQAGG